MRILRVISNLLLLVVFLEVTGTNAQESPRHPRSSKAPSGAERESVYVFDEGAIIRGDQRSKRLALVFTGDQFADGAETIQRVLKRNKVKASFFFTGRFFRNPAFESTIKQLGRDGHYLGAHSDQHLLYCDWNNRQQLLVTKEEFVRDLNANYDAMKAFGISKRQAQFFLPPFEWYNRTIVTWTEGMGLRLVNFTPGTRSNADYTTPEMKNYIGSENILQRIKEYEAKDANGLNGFLLLMHIGVAPERTDKFYDRLDDLIKWLRQKKYEMVRIDKLLSPSLQ